MKRHFEVLDGLRGTAALLVVLLHLLEVVYVTYARIPLRHAYLAVDFFFLLSGYVVGYAYDDRWPGLRIRDFIRIRLIRLHPLVLLGVGIGAVCYRLDPFAGLAQHVSLRHLAANLFFGALLLPFPALPNGENSTHSLDPPSWSLLQEYLVNLVYILLAWRLSNRALGIVVVVAAGFLAAIALGHGHLQGGWGWDTFWMAPVRVAFPFSAGLLLYRRRLSFRLPGAAWLLPVVLVVVFAAPAFQPAGYYDAFCVIIVFPLVVTAGAGTHVSGCGAKICQWAGRLSYPLYLLHLPFVNIFSNWAKHAHPPTPLLLKVLLSLVGFLLGLAWAALRFYDEPVRAWFTARARQGQPAFTALGTKEGKKSSLPVAARTFCLLWCLTWAKNPARAVNSTLRYCPYPTRCGLGRPSAAPSCR